MQKHVVIARFDPETDAQLTAWKQLALKMQTVAPANSSEWPPHMTIAAYEDELVEGLIRWCDEFAAEHSPIEIVFANLGLIPHRPNRPTDVLSVAPCNSLALTQFITIFMQNTTSLPANTDAVTAPPGCIRCSIPRSRSAKKRSCTLCSLRCAMCFALFAGASWLLSCAKIRIGSSTGQSCNGLRAPLFFPERGARVLCKGNQ